MSTVLTPEKPIEEALFQFVFPFTLTHRCQDRLIDSLVESGFEPFRLDDLKQEDRYYGPRHRVSHPHMERYYLPFTGQVLFPANDHPGGFRRLSKSFDDLPAELVTGDNRMPFRVYSADVLICPFDTGFITLRTELKTSEAAGFTLTDAIEYADRMRTLQDISAPDADAAIVCERTRYAETEEFLFQRIAPQLLPFLDKLPMEGTYFEKLPFMMDERMFVVGFYRLEAGADITLEDRYRAARLDGRGPDGAPFINASHPPYIENYCSRYGYERWAPDTYFLTDENCFCCLTRQSEASSRFLAGQMYGEFYYGLLLNLFHHIVLLKLSNAYSRVQIERKPDETEILIRQITSFSAKYYFLEIVSQTSGREIFNQLRGIYGNDELFEDVKQTLNDLFKYQENATSKKSSYLLTILTIYTVISGIYGMNQVIDDLKAPVKWSAMNGYSLFQWIALVVAFSGLIVSASLAVGVLWRLGADFLRKRVRG